MKRTSHLFLILTLMIWGCQSGATENQEDSETQIKETSELEAKAEPNAAAIQYLDSLDRANAQAIAESNNLNKIYVYPDEAEIAMTAYMRMDHRIFGYESADTTSKKVVLFSIFTDDVEGNPFQLELGAYYDFNELGDMTFKFIERVNGFAQIEAQLASGENRLFYFADKDLIYE